MESGKPHLTQFPHGQAILHQEGHMDDALSLTRCQQEESQAARMIYSTAGLYNQFIKYVWCLVGVHSPLFFPTSV